MARKKLTTSETLKSTGPTTDALKEKFKAQSIPLETDFADLIDIATVGRDALGQKPGQDGGLGFGLESEGGSGSFETGKKIKVKAGEGVEVSSAGVSAKIKELGGLKADGDGLGLRLFGGEESGNASGLKVDLDGIQIKAAGGITVDGDGVSVRAGTGITVDGDGVSVRAGTGITVDGGGVSVRAGTGITVDGGGVSVRAGTGITVDGGGVSISSEFITNLISLIIPSGTIVAYSGWTENPAPEGWEYCNGGAYNLVGRVLVGASEYDSSGTDYVSGGSPYYNYTYVSVVYIRKI